VTPHGETSLDEGAIQTMRNYHPARARCQEEKSNKTRCLTGQSVLGKATVLWALEAYTEYVSMAKSRPACAKPLRQRQGTPLTDFYNSPTLPKTKTDHTEFVVLAIQQHHVYRECILRLFSWDT